MDCLVSLYLALVAWVAHQVRMPHSDPQDLRHPDLLPRSCHLSELGAPVGAWIFRIWMSRRHCRLNLRADAVDTVLPTSVTRQAA